MMPVFFGLIIGLAAALALGRLIASQLYEVSAHNPLLLLATASRSASPRSSPASSPPAAPRS